MTGFDRISLPILAILAVLGLAAPFALAAKTRLPLPIIIALVVGVWTVVALVVGTWAVVVLVSAAVVI